ncbi:MAG: TonB-dependent receptor [Muribaculaceae bacterium]|nr:TonB-dependent receptor [Muribaculaceae bacterium]
MNKGRYIIWALLMTIATGAYAALIKGNVVDSSNQPLVGATVRLMNPADCTLVSASMIDEKGAFSFDKIGKGKYLLNVSMIGMNTISQTVDIKSKDQQVDLGQIVASESSITLDEAVVKGVQTAVTARQDTIEYNAGSFHTQPNAMVEDLLKRLPGVEVDSDGKITSGGKTITKILVDGKEFFSDDPKMASKNLPSDMVDKVQIVDRKSDLARLTGVDDGEEETVINLTVKKGMQNGWFGNVQGGYGTDNRYAGGFNVNHFKDGNQFTILGSANNTNDMTFTDQGRGRFSRFGGQNGITTTQSIGINFNVGKGDDLRFGGNVMYAHRNQDSRQRSTTEYLFADSTSQKTARQIARDNGHNVRADFRLQWNIDPNNTIDFRPRFSFNSNSSNRADSTSLFAGDALHSQVNRSINHERNRGTSYEASGDLIYNHKFASRPGRSMSVQTKYSFSDTREKGTSWSDIIYYLASDDNETLSQFIDSHDWSNMINTRLTWTEPLGDAANGNFLNVAYRLSYRWNNADRLTYNLDSDYWTLSLLESLKTLPFDAVLDEANSNSFRNEFFNQELQVGFKKVHKMYNLDAGLLFTPSMSKSEDLINPDRNLPERWVYNFAPYLRFRYKFTDRMSLSSDYRARTSQPSVRQLQPVADVSDPLNIVIGNPNLKPTFNQNLSLRFNDFNVDTQRSIMAMINGSYTMNSIVSNTIYDSTTGRQTTTYANVDGAWSLMGMMLYNQQIGVSPWRVSAQVFGHYNSTLGYNNARLNRSGSLMLRPQIGVTFTTSFLQVSLSPQYGMQHAHNSLADLSSSMIHSYGAKADVTVHLPFGVDFQTDLNYSSSTGYTDGYDSQQWLWNAQLSYSTLPSRSLTFALKAYDILQQRKNISRTITANYILDREYNDLTRYLMLTVTWKFSTLGSSQKNQPNMPPFDGDFPQRGHRSGMRHGGMPMF